MNNNNNIGGGGGNKMRRSTSQEDYLLPTLQEEGDGDLSSTIGRTVSFSDEDIEKGKKKKKPPPTSSSSSSAASSSSIPPEIPPQVSFNSSLPPASSPLKSYVKPLSHGTSSASSGGSVDNMSSSASNSSAARSRTYRDVRTSSSISASGVHYSTGGASSAGNNNNNTNSNSSDSSHDSSRILKNPLGFSQVLQQRSDTIRASIARGRSSIASRHSSISSYRSSSSLTSSQESGTRTGRQNQWQHQQQRRNSSRRTNQSSPYYSQTKRNLYKNSAAISRAARVYRGYSVGHYALVISEGSSSVPTNLTVRPTMGAGRASNYYIVNHAGLVTTNGTEAGAATATAMPPQAGAVGGGGGAVDGGRDNNNNNNNNIMLTAHLVNRHGYPKGEGSNQTERRGPYLYLLSKIKQVHYEENEVFWTVTRQDNGEDMRGDAGYMEPIPTEEGLLAAQRAAARTKDIVERGESNGDMRSLVEGDGYNDRNGNALLVCIVNIFCIIFCLPVFCIYELFTMVKESETYATILRHGNLFLNGIEPYKISCRITSVNLIVLCSVWYLFIDQFRLAYLPPSADKPLAIVNFVVWLLMVLELIFEAFIRPEGWHTLIRSDKAFTPRTARYISGIHLCVESISLVFFIPVFYCIFDSELSCSDRVSFSFLRATLASVVGPSLTQAWYGRVYYGIVRFRVFALVRHWRNAWLDYTFLNQKKYKKRRKAPRYLSDERSISTIGTMDDDDSAHVVAYGDRDYFDNHQTPAIQEEKVREEAKLKASNIGTALMVVNSHRALFMLCFLTACFPMLFLLSTDRVVNPVGGDMVEYLQAINLQDIDYEDSSIGCDFLYESVEAWSKVMIPRFNNRRSNPTRLLLSISIRPPRCYDTFNDTNIGNLKFYVDNNCPSWSWPGDGYSGDCIYGNARNITENTTSLDEVANALALRVGSIKTYYKTFSNIPMNTTINATTYAVSASYNYTQTIEHGARFSFFLQLLLLIIIVGSLQTLRFDAVNLVLGSLRSMLRIVARYAKNPLAQSMTDVNHGTSGNASDSGSYTSAGDEEEDQIVGTYETEQLVTAVTKITDLLRKCWGVAGADIISTNLASRNGDFEVFNPTVPGKNVFALFAFAAICDFDHALKNLGGDVMILINDVAVVVHGEVFRWGLGDSGQCNKNLGSSFFMVFKIGFVKEVVEKLEEATRVVFSTANGRKASIKKRPKRGSADTGIMGNFRSSSLYGTSVKTDRPRATPNFVKGLKTNLHAEKDVAMEAMAEAMQLSLQQIPGISSFADRAVIGMLKSFASIHRDNQLRAWSRDFRLSAGVGTWSVDMIFGMDAGWAVEGAVGSEYKIDATYLSPHVNMAARMMSACKHYGVTILVSQAVQELMTEPAKNRMRNLDRVTVKGSSHVQNIYTYDARAKGANFFLSEISNEQADHQARNYEPSIWNEDPDLKAMRHHVTEDFELEFMAGMKCYYDGDWPAAIEKLEKANEIMVDAAMEEGYLHDEMDDSPDRKELYRSETSDRPSRYLVNFMKSKGSKAPEDWDGWHPLLSK